MNYIYFHTSSDEQIKEAMSNGTQIICNSEPRDLPDTGRGQLWQELRTAELLNGVSLPTDTLSADELADEIFEELNS